MQDDYLNLALELYEKGIWNEETFIKKVTLYGQEKNIPLESINELINRVFKKKEYTIEDKRKFLSVLTMGDNEPKYGDVVATFNDDMVEKFYDLEVSSLDDKEVQRYFDLINSKSEVLVAEPSKPILKPVQKLKVDDLFDGNAMGEGDKPLNLPSINSNEETLSNGFYIPGDLNSNVETPSSEEVTYTENNNSFAIPSVSDSDTSDMPESEEEFNEQAENILSQEEDSVVTPVNAEPERIEKLKKSKSNVKSFFLKTAIVVASVVLLNPANALLFGLGYWYFADRIKRGDFNPENPIGKAIKSGVEYVMNIGKDKDEIEAERGKTR